MMKLPFLPHSAKGIARVSRGLSSPSVRSLLLWLGYWLLVPITFADTLTPLSNIEDAKADILLLDRQLSAIENSALYPTRTTLLFGQSAKSAKQVSQLSITMDGSMAFEQRLTDLDRLSLSKGGMLTVYDANLAVGLHTLVVSYTLAQGVGSFTQTFNINKKQDKTILGLRLQDRPPPRKQPLSLQEWIVNAP